MDGTLPTDFVKIGNDHLTRNRDLKKMKGGKKLNKLNFRHGSKSRVFKLHQ